MNKVTLKFNTSRTTFHTATAELPQAWSDVPQDLIPGIIAQVSLPRSSSTYREVLRILFRINKKTWADFLQYNFSRKASHQDREHNASGLLDILGPVFWMWETPLTAKPYPFVMAGPKKLLIPDPDLKYISWGELVDALIHYELFTSQMVEGTKHLDLLIATFCRPERPMKEKYAADWNGDPRVRYNSYHAETLAGLVKDLPEETKTNLLVYFAGVTAQLFRAFELSDGSGESEEYPGQSFTKNTFNMAEKGIFGNYDQTRAKNCHEVLVFLEEYRKDIQAQKEHMEELRNQ